MTTYSYPIGSDRRKSQHDALRRQYVAALRELITAHGPADFRLESNAKFALGPQGLADAILAVRDEELEHVGRERARAVESLDHYARQVGAYDRPDAADTQPHPAERNLTQDRDEEVTRLCYEAARAQRRASSAQADYVDDAIRQAGIDGDATEMESLRLRSIDLNLLAWSWWQREQSLAKRLERVNGGSQQ